MTEGCDTVTESPSAPCVRVDDVGDARDGLLHPVLAGRWSPTVFDPDANVSTDEVEALLEAARWAPSAGNSQPWAFILARRGEPEHARLVRYLARSSAAWAPAAGVLVANLAHRFVADTDWDYSEFSTYDLGQAVAYMTVQAHVMGLHVRQFRAFDREGIAAEFAVPPHWQVTTMAAIGRVPAAALAQARTAGAGPVRERRARDELRWPAADDAP